MSGRSEYREMTMTLVGPVDGYPVDKTDGYVYLFGEQDSKKSPVHSSRTSRFSCRDFFSNSLA